MNALVKYEEKLPVAHNETPLGTADWLRGGGKAIGPYKPGDLWLGEFESGGLAGARDDRHVLVCSGTRGGKGISFIIKNLICWQGSAIVLDPKGENAIVTARRRAGGSKFARGRKQTVRILDPFNEVKTPLDDFKDLKATFNPMAALRADREESVDDAALIAESLIVAEGSSDPFFDYAAKDAIKAIILHVATWRDYQPHERNLVTVRRLLLEGDARLSEIDRLQNGKKNSHSGFSSLCAVMKRNRAFDGIIASAGARFEDLEKQSPRTLGSILEVARTNTDFIESPGMRRVLSSSSFELHELKTLQKGMSLYLCLPQRFMGKHFRWLRMMTALTIGEMERVKQQPACGHPVLTVLDEFAALKRMTVIENAAAQIAGFGVKLMFVAQTLAQLKDIYKDNWETLVANAGVKLFFSNDDNFTQSYVSKLVGETEVVRTAMSLSQTQGKTVGNSSSITAGWSASHTVGRSSGLSGGGGHLNASSGTSESDTFGVSGSETHGSSNSDSLSRSMGYSQSIQKRALVTPDEVGRIFGNREHPRALVLISGYQPLSLRRTFYFEERALEGFFDPHPDHPLPPTLEQLTQVRAEREQARVASEAQNRWTELLRRQEQELEAEIAQEKAREVQAQRQAYSRKVRAQQRREQIREYVWMAVCVAVVGGAAGWFLWKTYDWLLRQWQ